MHIKRFDQLFESNEFDIGSIDWVSQYEIGMFDLVRVSLEAYGLLTEVAMEKGGIGGIDSRINKYGIMLRNRNIREYASGLKTEYSEYIGPSITIGWLIQKFTLADKILTKRYGGRNRVMIEFKKESIDATKFKTLSWVIDDWIEKMREINESLNNIEDTFDLPEEDGREYTDIVNMVDLGMIPVESLYIKRREILTKNKESIQKKFNIRNLVTPISSGAWFKTNYGQVFSADLYKALQSQSFQKLKSIGYQLDNQSIGQLMNGTIILTIPGIKSKILISNLKKSVYRLTGNSNTLLSTPPYKNEQFYIESFEYVANSLDPTDQNLATKIGADRKRKRVAQYHLFIADIREAYEKVVSKEHADIILNRLTTPPSGFSLESVESYGIIGLKEFAIDARTLAKNGFIYIASYSYEKFFTKELEDLFITHNIPWAATGLTIGSASSTDDLSYQALKTFEFAYFVRTTTKILYLNIYDKVRIPKPIIKTLEEKAKRINDMLSNKIVSIRRYNL